VISLAADGRLAALKFDHIPPPGANGKHHPMDAGRIQRRFSQIDYDLL
jgi:hypothetical protein